MVVCVPTEEAVIAGTEGADVGFTTSKDGESGSGVGAVVTGAVADNALSRLGCYDGADGGGAISNSERRARAQGMS